MSKLEPDEFVVKAAVILGALAAAAVGFTEAGVGEALVAVPLGGIAGYLAGAFIWIIDVEMMPFWFLCGVVATIIWVISALWGVLRESREINPYA